MKQLITVCLESSFQGRGPCGINYPPGKREMVYNRLFKEAVNITLQRIRSHSRMNFHMDLLLRMNDHRDSPDLKPPRLETVEH